MDRKSSFEAVAPPWSASTPIPERSRSTALALLHFAGDDNRAMRAFGKWIHAGERVPPGLVIRRAEEAALYAAA